ncbi:MAG: hypothetical protein JKY15_04330 [Deltaproteobacteria bacterium]|nr:hypothetical protein [Deltaproteobacteria bacterium]
MIDHEAAEVNRVSLEVLGEDFINLHADSLELKEDFLNSQASVKARLTQTKGDEKSSYEVIGSGVGLVDAYFEALLASFSKEYVSLNTISIVDFNIHIKMTGSAGRHTDAIAIAALRIKNSDRHEYVFEHKSVSVSQSSVGAAQDAIQFFIDAERAYTKLHFALEDAKERTRSDLVQKYQIQMGTLVKATSYKEIAERLKQPKAS